MFKCVTHRTRSGRPADTRTFKTAAGLRRHLESLLTPEPEIIALLKVQRMGYPPVTTQIGTVRVVVSFEREEAP